MSQSLNVTNDVITSYKGTCVNDTPNHDFILGDCQTHIIDMKLVIDDKISDHKSSPMDYGRIKN